MDDEKRPQCTCEKTECLRRYCRCFDSRWFCSEKCSCQGCRNTEDNEDEVEERVEIIMKKKRDAFRSKIAGDAGFAAAGSNLGQETRMHVKGCNCLKSECKKLYCECFKHKVGCSARCQCKGCGNSYGVKGAAETDRKQVDDNGNPNGTPGGSSGTCNGTSPVTDEEMYWTTEASMMGNFVPFPGNWSVDLDPRSQASGDGGLEDMFLGPFGDADYIQHNVQPQTHQGFGQADESARNTANPVSQGPSNLNTGSQINFGRS